MQGSVLPGTRRQRCEDFDPHDGMRQKKNKEINEPTQNDFCTLTHCTPYLLSGITPTRGVQNPPGKSFSIRRDAKKIEPLARVSSDYSRPRYSRLGSLKRA